MIRTRSRQAKADLYIRLARRFPIPIRIISQSVSPARPVRFDFAYLLGAACFYASTQAVVQGASMRGRSLRSELVENMKAQESRRVFPWTAMLWT
ncbi:hypothetical protein M422DRAFT_276873 [Sphaerobolus stellatus SS14]|uniref:Uncharacterized protein n=1 Tax=Sphaerobolus stellatus (strain SS14) TaxID=990650 RepID=A0A0C9T1K0_SPHS4|nr:hypothetical protein M422DRAFT_276873 [Sphaerobolus stellatus SS14]